MEGRLSWASRILHQACMTAKLGQIPDWHGPSPKVACTTSKELDIPRSSNLGPFSNEFSNSNVETTFLTFSCLYHGQCLINASPRSRPGTVVCTSTFQSGSVL